MLPRVFFVGALVLGLRMAGTSPWLQRLGLVLLPISLLGNATPITGALFPVLALSTLGYELWVGRRGLALAPLRAPTAAKHGGRY